MCANWPTKSATRYHFNYTMPLFKNIVVVDLKGRLCAVGEKLTHWAPGPGFDATSLHICGGKGWPQLNPSPEPHSSGSRLTLGLPFCCSWLDLRIYASIYACVLCGEWNGIVSINPQKKHLNQQHLLLMKHTSTDVFLEKKNQLVK
jgi:hypothetical protein